MKERMLSASEFKAKSSACLTEIEETGEPITITRRGRPVAVLGPVKRAPFKSPAGILAKKGKIVGDIVHFSPWEVAETE